MDAGETGDAESDVSQPYPIVLTALRGWRCVVVGGGVVAERKVAGLLPSGADIAVISPTLTRRLAEWVGSGAITHQRRPFRPGDLLADGSRPALAFAATGDGAVNAEVAREARELGVLVNVADDPEAGSFNTVAAIRRDDLLLTVSTGGASPALAALIRRKLDALIGPEYAELAALLRGLRRAAARRLDARSRERLWRELVSEESLAAIADGQAERLRSRAGDLIRRLEPAGEAE